MSTKSKDRITQVKMVRPCSHLETGFVCGHYGLDGTWVSCQGDFFDVAWIESRFAKLGKRVQLEEDKTVWTITEVYGSKDIHDLDGQHSAWREFGKKLGY